jgi:anti-sigma B factor antagonist
MASEVEHDFVDWGKAWVRTHEVDGRVIVTVGGEIDMQTAVGLDRAISSASRRALHVIVEMSEVSFVDSMGLGVLVGARNRAQEGGGSILLVSPPEAVRRLLTGTQLQRSFPVFDTLDEALVAAGRRRM